MRIRVGGGRGKGRDHRRLAVPIRAITPRNRRRRGAIANGYGRAVTRRTSTRPVTPQGTDPTGTPRRTSPGLTRARSTSRATPTPVPNPTRRRPIDRHL